MRRPSHRPSRFRPELTVLEGRCLPASDPILAWNEVLLQANAADHSRPAPEQGGPNLTARAFAVVSVAMYDAFNSTNPVGRPYFVRVPHARNADTTAAVAQAAHDTLVALYPSQAAAFDAALTRALAGVRDGPREDRGREVGCMVAATILQARTGDMADSIQVPGYEPSGLPGFHDVDPLNPGQGFYAPDYMDVAPFAIPNADFAQARPLDDGTPEGRMAFLQSDEYTAAYNEVVALGGDGVTTPTSRTAEQTIIGHYWGYDGAPGLGTPPRLYNQIARVVAEQEGNTPAENARLFALVNVAMADAGLSCWNSKYDNDFWRPILGVRGGEGDGNAATAGDADWTPLGAALSNGTASQINFTPPFPAYTSGHATFGAALFQTLTRFYGTDNVTFTFVSDEYNGATTDAGGTTPRPLVPRTFHSFSEASFENAQSRIYLGVHWAFDRDEGIACGNVVADYVFDHMMQPGAHGGGPKPGNETPVEKSTVLAVYGTAGDDVILIGPGTVTVNGHAIPLHGADWVVVFAGSGDDTVIVADDARVPVSVHGGAGVDAVVGESHGVYFVQDGVGGPETGDVSRMDIELETDVYDFPFGF